MISFFTRKIQNNFFVRKKSLGPMSAITEKCNGRHNNFKSAYI